MASSAKFIALLDDTMKKFADATLTNNAEEEPHKLNAHAGYYRGLKAARALYEEHLKQED